MSGKKLGGVLVLCVSMLLVVVGYSLYQADAVPSIVAHQAPANNEPTSGHVVPVAHTAQLAEERARSMKVELPPSLRGTEIDGGFRVDEEGHLIVDKSIKRFLDYFLGTVGEQSVEEIISNIESMIEQSLQEPAKSEAMAVLTSYVGYKQALYDLEQEIGEVNLMTMEADQLSGMEERLRQIRETRRSYLGEDISQAFFAEEEAVDQYTFKKLLVMNDLELDAQERQEKLKEIEVMLPEKVREQRAATRIHETLSEKEAELKSSGASQDEIYAARAELVGDEAAQRLAALDAKRADFRNRLREYRIEKHVLDETAMDDADKAQALEQLRGGYFSEVETRRVAALDRIGAE